MTTKLSIALVLLLVMTGCASTGKQVDSYVSAESSEGHTTDVREGYEDAQLDEDSILLYRSPGARRGGFGGSY